ncbi:methyltransferase domain-containing protein [Thermobifida halotolerans]|uniref:Protein-L-isoaspartate O-methyltransferase n=1 Tax=Thermobifida halotolerans TaxID=483545 RepID=A0A399G1Y1_9ACTN|nr:methyltransferase domain-containing protein [Thermobifida halotolerans]UOE20488.1 methyltransferase domain-containing protein [Thermobifida halotolerans]
MTAPRDSGGPAALVGLLRERGLLGDPAWERAFLRVERHRFVPDVIWAVDADRSDGQLLAVGRDDPYWWQTVHQDVAIATQVDDGSPAGHGGRGRYVTSSASQPSLMLAMLDSLDATEGMRVLEIGTGTGYNAALLAARLGSARVVSVEIDAALAEHARRRLASAGFAPTVVVGDGAEGAPEHAPYDRVLATAAAGDIPYAWVAQTRPGGLVLLPWGNPYSSTGLLRLRVAADGTASGRVLTRAGFMWLRQQRAPTGGWRRYVDTGAAADVSATAVDPGDLLHLASPARFAVGALVPGLCQVVLPAADGSGESTLWLYDGSGAWASVDHVPGADIFTVEQHGRRRLWDEVERAHRWWRRSGRPDRERFGVTVTPESQTVWLDEPDHPIPAPLGG